MDSNKVIIVGGRDTLKKKLHMGLLAYLMQVAANSIMTTRKAFFINVEHKESGKDSMVEAQIKVKPDSQKLAIM